MDYSISILAAIYRLNSNLLRINTKKTDTLVARYAVKFDVGDIDGDSFDDLIIWSNQLLISPKDSVDHYLEIIYGKADFSSKDSIPDVEFHREQYPFLKDQFTIVDLNGDGIDDICFMILDTLLFQLGKKKRFTVLGPFEHIPNPDQTQFRINSDLFRIGDFNGDGYDDFMTIVYHKQFAAWFFTVYLCGPHWYTIPAYYYLRGGNDLRNLANDVSGIGDINGDGGAEYLITKPIGEMRNDFLTYNDGYFVVVKSDTLLKLGVNDAEHPPADFKLHFYPNPSTSNGVIEISQRREREEQMDIFLTDVLGRRVLSVYRGEISGAVARFPINLAQLQSGTYYIHLVTQSASLVKKIIHVK